MMTVSHSQNLGILLNKLERNFNVTKMADFTHLVNFSESRKLPIHRWLNYREGYSPSLVSYFVKQLSPSNFVLDPFCGSGTSLVTSKYSGCNAYGIDTNPIAILASTVKTQSYNTEDILSIQNIIREILSGYIRAKVKAPNFSSINKVFDAEILADLLSLRQMIINLENKIPPHTYNFIFLAWIAILEPLSYTYKEGNGIKYRKKITFSPCINLHESTIESTLAKNLVQQAFIDKCNEMLQDIEQNCEIPSGSVQIIQGSCLEEIDRIENRLDLVIGSPPYANRFDYFEIYKVELWMSGILKSYEEFRERRKKIIRSNLMTSALDDSIVSIPELEYFINLMNPKSATEKRIVIMLRNYFADMYKLYESSYEKLNIGGKMVLVIGNSAYMNTLVPVDLLLATIASKIGFKEIRINVARTLTTSSQQRLNLNAHVDFLRESILEVIK